MKKYLKYSILLLYTALVIFLIIFASGYTSLTNCEYHRAGSNSLIPILVITILSFIVGLVLKMGKDRRYIFVVTVAISSFFIMSHFKKKKYHQLLEEEKTTIVKAIIYDIKYHQFTTFLSFKAFSRKKISTLGLKNKSDLGRIKIGDTILIKYVDSCYFIKDFHNLSPTKEELAKY